MCPLPGANDMLGMRCIFQSIVRLVRVAFFDSPDLFMDADQSPVHPSPLKATSRARSVSLLTAMVIGA